VPGTGWRSQFDREGFILLEGFAQPDTCKAMLDRARSLARLAHGAGRIGDALVMPEAKPAPPDRPAEEHVSKIFRLHRQEAVFHAFCRRPELLEVVSALLGENLDCFLSQFIFKQPGAMGQPWHQDAFYFPFDRAPQIGVWLAVTEARIDNGPLHILPGSHREAVHEAIPDPREHANLGYVEIVDHDTRDASAVLLQPGDLLVFHSHLMHKSTDNESNDPRAAMVYHYAEAGTRDFTESRTGHPSPVNDWMPVLRSHAE
jgi:ectoine hydroxylase-related dioxygenase (phytanoyl-CoA dioxygenase family)